MKGVNLAIVCGRVGRDPEMKYLPSGQPIANFSIATEERWKDKASGEQKKQVEWHRIVLFGPLAETAGKHVRQGQIVHVSGRMQTRKWQDKNGVERLSPEIRADSMQIIDWGDDDKPSQQKVGTAPAPAAAPEPDDDIPF